MRTLTAVAVPAVVVALAGCAPSLQALSAPQIGCAESALDLPVAALERISAAKNASARVCDEQLVFSDRSRAALGELVAQIHGTPQKP